MRQDSTSLHISAVIGAAFLWSTSFAVTKVVLRDVGALTLGALRFLAAGILLITICLFVRVRLRAPLRSHAVVAGAGLVGVTICFSLENYGDASYPVMTMVAEAIFHHRQPATINVAGALVAFAGVALVTANKPAQEVPYRPWGIIFLLLGGLAWTAYNMMSAQKQVNVTSNRRLGVLITTGLQNLWGGIGFCLLVPILPEGVNTNLRSSAVWLIIYLAIGCSAVAFLLYTFGLTALKPSQAVAMLNLVPVFGVVWAIAIAGEHITPLKAIGAVTIIVGVAMNARNPQLSQEKQTHRHCIPSKG